MLRHQEKVTLIDWLINFWTSIIRVGTYSRHGVQGSLAAVLRETCGAGVETGALTLNPTNKGNVSLLKTVTVSGLEGCS